MGSISIKLNEKEEKLIRDYAKLNNISLSDFIRNAIMEKIEDEYNLKCYEEAIDEFKKDSKTFTLDEIEKEIYKNNK